jgi:hypothetical protein
MVSTTQPASVGCTGKVAFDNFTQANAVVNRFQTKARPGRSVYRCGHCHKWHLGTDKGRVDKHRANELKDQRNYE